MEIKKYRVYIGIWYPEEDPSHLFALNKLKTSGYNYCAIDHDKDTYTEFDECEPDKIGSLKKKHTHIFIRLKSARYLVPFAEELGIAPNYLQPCHNTEGSLMYMLHNGYPDKYQYDESLIYGTLKFEVEKMVQCSDESSRVLKLLDLLDSMPKPCTYRQFLVAVCNNSLYGDFRRMGSGIKTLLDEHNGFFNCFDN